MLKKVQFHDECVCGKNVVYQSVVNFSWRFLRRRCGFPRKDKDGLWFSWYTFYPECDCDPVSSFVDYYDPED